MLHAMNAFVAINLAAQASYAGASFLSSLAIGVGMLALGWITMAYAPRT